MGKFRKSSRYYNQKIITITNKQGQKVPALSLRIIPLTKGKKQIVKQIDRLDIISQQEYNDPTKFWYIADANTELDATKLVSKKIQTIVVPKAISIDTQKRGTT